MIGTLLTFLLVLTPCQATNQISEAQKKEFIKLLQKLPFKGEFYTDEAVEKASPYLPVLFAFTQKDIKKHDIYPFVAISRGFGYQKNHQDYGVRHFGEIRHPTLKLFWGAMLFNEGVASPEIAQFLKDALASREQGKLLSEMSGPKFEDFKRRVLAYPANK